MKRLLVVLFGVLVFQGSVWALPSGGDLCKQNGDGGKARVLSPADTQQLNKGSAILLQWSDSSDWLGNKVTIELHSRKGKTEQVVKTWPLQINTGSALITRADLRGAKIKKASKKDIRYVFRLKNHAKAKRFIDSGCFTFTKSEKSQRQRRNLKEEIEGLESTLTQALADISDLTDRLDALEEGGGTVIGGDGDEAQITATYTGCRDLDAEDRQYCQPDGTLWTELGSGYVGDREDHTACWQGTEMDGEWVVGENGFHRKWSEQDDIRNAAGRQVSYAGIGSGLLVPRGDGLAKVRCY